MADSQVILLGFDGANPELIKKYAAEGVMPNVARLMARGVFGHYLSSVPPNTTVNWTTIATGANPGTHGITDFWLHFHGDPLDQFHDAFDSNLVQAEQIWYTAEKAGKTPLVMNYPVGYPIALENGYFIGGEGTPYSGSIFELRASSCFVTEAAAEGVTKAERLVMEAGQGLIRLTPTGEAPENGPLLGIHLAEGAGAIEVRDEGGSLLATVAERAWTDWLSAPFTKNGDVRTGRFRIYLSELGNEGRRIKIYISQTFPEDGYTQPSDLAAELLQVAGPHLSYCGAGPYRRGWCDIQAWFDEMRYKGHWMAKAAGHVVKTRGVDLMYSHFHMLDHVFHYIWGPVDPATDWFDAIESPEYEHWFQEAHRIVDETVGIYVDTIGEDATYIVISDHGLIPHVKSVSINNLLAEAGLIHFTLDEHRKPQVDWSRTKAYKPTDAVHIYLNMQGRDPEGIVPTEDYDQLQNEVINALLDLKDPENGNHPVAIALKKRDAALLGLWGDRVGDVIVLMNAEYTAQMDAPLSADGRVLVKMGPSEEDDDSSHSAVFQAVHGYTLPTSRIGRGGSEAGVLIMAGAGLRRGVELGVPVPGINVAPTVAHLLGIRPPANCEGQIHFKALD
jgi:predicted AlkP superfamily phosphohydrolase/phosphomutase